MRLVITCLFSVLSLLCLAQTGPAGVGDASSNRMWLKADTDVYSDAGTTPASNGNLVQQWNDQSGNGIHATQAASGNRPTYATGIVNGKPALQFSGNTFVDGSTLGIAGTGGFSFVFLFQATSYTAGAMNNGAGHYIMDRTSATNELTGIKITNTDKYGFQKRSDSGGGLGGPVSTSAVNTASFELINYRRVRGTSYDLFLNGTLETSIADGDGNLTPPVPRIGRHATTANNGLNGYIAEMMVFDFDINNAQVNIINSYLAAKYGLSVANDKYTFDATHEVDVAGIGREDAGNFHDDAQSASILQVNTPSSLGNGDYLLFGHNDASIATWTSTEAPNAGVNINRLSREWRFNETGDVGTVKFTIDTTLLPARTTNYTTYVLMVDADGDFSDGASIYEMDSPGGNNLFETASAIAIADGDYVAIGEVIPSIEFSSATSSGFETSNASLPVSLNYIAKNPVSVTYNSADGSAVAPGDYTAVVGGSLTVMAGTQSANINITLANDVTVESDETLTVTISAPTAGVNLGTNTVHTYTIQDDDNPRKIYFTAANSSGDESVLTVNLTVSIDVGQIDPVNPTTVDYAVSGGTATGGGTDFTLAAGTATIAANQQTTTISITVVDDALYESSETIIVDLSSPTNGNLSIINPIQYTYTITDNETPPELGFTSASSSGSESVTTVNIPVSLSFASGQVASANYTVTGGSASGGGTDYTLANGTVTFPATTTTVNIPVTVVDDSEVELLETIEITLSSFTNANSGTTVHTYSIIDDDVFGFSGPGGVGDSNYNKLWLKADTEVYNDAGTTLASNTNTVQQWNDQSGNANNASQGSGSNRPIFATNVINNLPALNFTGNTYIDPGALGIAGSGGFSYVLVLQATSFVAGTTSNGSGHYILDRTSGTNSLASLKVSNTNKFGFQKRTDTGSGLGGPNSTTAINTGAFQLVNYMRVRGSAYELYVDGTLEASQADSDGDITPPTTRIGRHATTSGLGLNGYIAELAIYDRDLNEAQRIIVENYLAAKYGLSILPASDKYAYDATYGFEVAGIGRENASEFHTDAQGSGIVRINNASSLDAGDYLLWGHDNDTLTKINIVDIPAVEGIQERKERVWRVTETNEVGTVDIRFDLSHFGGSISAADLRLLVDRTNNGFADETLAGGTIISGATDLGGNIYQFTGVNLDDSWEFTLGTLTSFQPPLPIDLIDFRARLRTDNKVDLHWETASEYNNDYFTVERSKNGIDWDAIINMPGAGNSNAVLSYQAIDDNPFIGVNYYRLKQTDISGEFDFSPIRSVTIEATNNSLVQIYPNPANSYLIISGSQAELERISILNSVGQNVTGLTTIKAHHAAERIVDLSKLESGIYFIRTKTTANKVYKQ